MQYSRTLRTLFSQSRVKCCRVNKLCTSSNLCILDAIGRSADKTASAEVIQRFRDVMRSVPAPVVIATTSTQTTDRTPCIKRGVTCSSFTSVSMQPPIISLCIKKPSRMHNLLTKTKCFAVNVLAQDQVHYSVHFATPANDDDDQFSAIPHTQGIAGVPLIGGAAAVLQCHAHDVHTIGDHHVWYGEVIEGVPLIGGAAAVLQCHAHDIHTIGDHHVWYGEVIEAQIDNTHGNQPLIYFAKSYRSVGDETFMKAFEDTTLLFEDWTHEAHLRMSWNYIKKYGSAEDWTHEVHLRMSWNYIKKYGSAEVATPIIRKGIQKYNEQNKEKIERGYHETVTIFYIAQVAHALKQCDNPDVPFEEFLAINNHLTDSKLLFQYYSKQLISSTAARLGYQPPDLKALPE